MTETEFNAYLLTPAWAQKQAQTLQRDKYWCQGCLEQEASLVAHRSFDHLGAEPLYDLVSVCPACFEMLAAETDPAQTQMEVHRLGLEVLMLKATVEGLRKLPGMNQIRTDRLQPLYTLLASRVRNLEEAAFSPETVAEMNEYWVRALQTLGIEPDPLRLEGNG